MVIRLLHQRQWNGRRLRVEFAKPEQIRRLPSHHVCDLTLKRYFYLSNNIKSTIHFCSLEGKLNVINSKYLGIKFENCKLNPYQITF